MQLTLLNLVTFGMSLWLGEVSAARRVPRMKQFPEQFSFGASSAAYQIEGGWNLDGRTPSVWDKFTHEHPELVADHSNGDVSADSYHFFRSDVEALKNVGVKFLNLLSTKYVESAFGFSSISTDFQYPGREC